MDVVKQTADDEELKDGLFRISLETGVGLDEFKCPYGRPVEIPDESPTDKELWEQQELRRLINQVGCKIAKQSREPDWKKIY